MTNHPTVDLSRFPEELKAERIWCLWKYESDPKGKLTKVPYRNMAQKASSTDPEQWQELRIVLENLQNPACTMDGIGCFVTPGRTWVDLDACVKNGVIEPWAQRVIDRLGSYSEYSPSLTGVHIYARGSVPEGKKENGCEAYSHGRYFTVTGLPVPRNPSDVLTESPQLHALHADLVANRLRPYALNKPEAPAPATTGTIIPPSGLTLEQLERGESPNGDASDGDFQFVALLAEQGLTDLQIDARFRASARMREKWDQKRGKLPYGELTIAKVRAKLAEAKGNIDADDWRSLFHSYDETLNAPPLTFVIEGWLQKDGITYFSGLPGHGKTLVMLNTARALLEGGKLFDYFNVSERAHRVLYLIPESGLGPFVHRLHSFRLLDHIRQGRFFYRTLSARDQEIGLDDPRILRAAEGADVFLDTAVRFMQGEENSASDHRNFAKMLFNLQKAGARTISGAHHSPKAFESRETVTLENALRGSGDVGAMLATSWALKQLDFEANRIYVKNVKARDFEACQPFEIVGRPQINDTGSFQMWALPGMSQGPGGPAVKTEKLEEARKLRAKGISLADIADRVQVASRTVERWSSEGKLAVAAA